MRDVLLAGQDLRALVQPGPADDRQRQEEREPRRAFAFEPEPASGGDGDARPRDPGLQRHRLGHPDEQGVGHAHVAEGPGLLGPSIHQVEHHAEHGQHHRDDVGLAQLVLDHAFEQRAGDGAGDRPDDQEPRQTLLDLVDPAAPDAAEPRHQVRHHVAPEVGQRPNERPQVQRDVEGLVQLLVGEDAPVEEPRHQDEVA